MGVGLPTRSLPSAALPRCPLGRVLGHRGGVLFTLGRDASPGPNPWFEPTASTPGGVPLEPDGMHTHIIFKLKSGLDFIPKMVC